MGRFEEIRDQVMAVEGLAGDAGVCIDEGQRLCETGKKAQKRAEEIRAAYDACEISLETAATEARAVSRELEQAWPEQFQADGPIPFAPTEPLKPVRKTRADAGKARGPRSKSNEERMQAGELPEDAGRVSAPKPHMNDGRSSPLDPAKRAAIEATLAKGPMQFPEIMKMSWTADLSESQVEALLCEDPTRFVRWEVADFGGLEAWGLAEHFDMAVGKLKMPGIPIESRPKFTASTLGCSVTAALEAWKRLDPRQT